MDRPGIWRGIVSTILALAMIAGTVVLAKAANGHGDAPIFVETASK